MYLFTSFARFACGFGQSVRDGEGLDGGVVRWLG